MLLNINGGLSFILFLTLVLNLSQADESRPTVKGRCPAPGMKKSICGDQKDSCQSNENCTGDSICCDTGCSKVCILPLHTACEQSQIWNERRARSLEVEDLEIAKNVHIPKCNISDGTFERIQYDASSQNYYCVDIYTGFEKQGTRGKNLSEVDCTNPRKSCNGPSCRMFCEFGFELDENGCEMCMCKDPCHKIKCPRSSKCELEDVACLQLPCPPLPSCKEPRSLDSLCPSETLPLILPETQKPYLCGRKEEGKPPCPENFSCMVADGNEYGVCCISFATMLVEKPGNCPVITGVRENDEKSDDCLVSNCDIDFQCPDDQKCCQTEKCGKVCQTPANSTICLQEKRIAELLSVKEIEGKGYIPQCDDKTGDFIPKQCSRNGLICWCVDDRGRNLHQSIGPAETVNCDSLQEKSSLVQTPKHRAVDSFDEDCDKVICSGVTCEFGYKVDRLGCPSCDCVEAETNCPLSCPEGSKCSWVTDPISQKQKPTCLSEYVYVNPCEVGTPLTDLESGRVVTCSSESLTCPFDHICVNMKINKGGLCCLNGSPKKLEETKPGICPFLSPSLCQGDDNNGTSNKCTSDNDCGENSSMKCCGCGQGAICADPLLNDPSSSRKDSMCEYLRDIGSSLEGILPTFKLAIPRPSCKSNGDFEEIQCESDGASCYCVNEYGSEIPGTRSNKGDITKDQCLESRNTPGFCLQMNCRLGCDYGYETLDNCPICECVNKCKEISQKADYTCEMIDVDCPDLNSYCPPLPFFIPKIATSGKCPKGEPFIDDLTNETLTCRPRARSLQCPFDHYCFSASSSINDDFGFCCPQEFDDSDQEVAEERHSLDSNILSDEGKNIFIESQIAHQMCPIGEPLSTLSGQKILCGPSHGYCPSSTYYCNLRNPFENGVCCQKPRSICFLDKEDGQCPQNEQKWYFNTESNSCEEFSGCSLPGNSNNFNSLEECSMICPSLTKCERIREKNLKLNANTNQLNYIPKCDENGEWVPVQSLPEVNLSWCVTKKGDRIKGSMTSGKPNCNFRQSRSRGGSLGFSLEQDKPEKVCPDGVTVHLCNATLCENKVCMAKPTADCVINPCGGCSVKFIDEENREIDCNEGLNSCQKQVQKVINSQSWINQGLSPIIQEIQDEQDLQQSHGLKFDSRPPTTAAGDYQEFNLGSGIRSSPSQITLDKALKELLAFESSAEHGEQDHRDQDTLVVEPDDGYPNIKPIFHKAETKPFFQNINGGKVMGLTSSSITIVGGRGSSGEHTGGNSGGKVQNIADILAEIMKGGSSSRLSSSSSTEDDKSSSEDAEDMIDLLPSRSEHYGSIRVPQMDNIFFPEQFASPSVVRSKRVRALDFDIDDEDLDSFEGLPSISPQQSPMPIPSRGGPGGLPFGLFPQNSQIMISIVRPTMPNERSSNLNSGPPPKSLSELFNFLTGLSPLQQSQSQSQSVPFPALPFFMGAQNPINLPLEEDFIEPVMMEVSPPRCSNGQFEIQQSYGDLTYCVNPATGEPYHETLTRGLVECLANGTVIKRISRGAPRVCQFGSPKVCINECISESCGQHPEAICVADPCDDCKVAFFMPSGERVHCQSKCEQSPDPGNCRAAFTRYFYNSSSGRCEEFLYGGCGGNENSFDTFDECQSKCPEVENDILLCPEIIDGSMKTCSKSKACEACSFGVQSLDACNCNCICNPVPEPAEPAVPEIDLETIIITNYEEPIVETTPPQIPIEEIQTIIVENIGELGRNDIVQMSERPNQKKLITLVNLEGIATRCQKFKELTNYISCDSQGQFTPMQCDEDMCHCVNEAGSQVEGSRVFPKGSKTCEKVPIEKVNVLLNFPISEETHPIEIESEMLDLLEQLKAPVEGNKMDLEIQPNAANLRFTLVGDNKVDVSYFLEEMVKTKSVGLKSEDKFTPADISNSRFYHIVSSPSGVKQTTIFIDESEISNEIGQGESLVRDDVKAEEVLTKEYDNLAIFLMVIAALTGLLAVIGIFLAFQKKKKTSEPSTGFKKPFELAFTSYIYEIEKKSLEAKKFTNPTFKVKPFENELEKKPSESDN